MPYCRSCNAEIEFLPMASTGKLHPIDAAPNPEGNIVIIAGKLHIVKADEDDGVAMSAEDNPYAPPRQRYMSHFATCKDAAKYRKRDQK